MNLKKLRLERGLRQEDMAKLINKSDVAYGYYESGRNEPDLQTLIKLADYFGCSVDYLVGHQTANTLQLDSLTEAQKQIIQRVHSLTEEQSFLVLGYLARIQEQPISNVIDQIKNLK